MKQCTALLLGLLLVGCGALPRPADAPLRIGVDEAVAAAISPALSTFEIEEGQPLSVTLLPAADLSQGDFDVQLGLLEPRRSDLPIGEIEYVLAVNNAVGLDEIELSQARQLLAGQVLNWADLGGASIAVSVYSRETGSSPSRLLNEQILAGLPLSASAQLLPSETALSEALVADPGGLAWLRAEALSPGAHALTIHAAGQAQVMRFEASLLARPHDEEHRPTQALIEWLVSPAGQSALGFDQ